MDGIPIGFYKDYWDIVGNHITQFVLKVLSGACPLHSINATDLCLIPKTQHQTTPADFRSMGL